MTAAAAPAATVPRPAPGAGAARAREEAPAAIVVEGVRKRFAVPRGWRDLVGAPRARRETTALDGLSLSVPEGRCFGVLGPNGAGKTTLFRVLAGTVLPDDGQVTVCGVDALAEPHVVRSLVAPAVNDERTLLWRLDARANLALYASLQGLGGAVARARAEEVLAVVGLADAGRARVAHYSSGMRQRLLVARALLARPRVLLLDEPTRSLDPLAARALRDFVRTELVGRQRCTVVLATHDTEEAFDVCDEVAVLHRGRALAQGAARPLAAGYCAPVWTAWVAGASDALPEALVCEGAAASAVWGAEREGDFRALRLEAPAAAEAGARLLARLTSDGARVARFEMAPPTLATLIDRIVQGAGA